MQNLGLIPELIPASNFHLIPGAINVILIRNHGTTSTETVKLQLRVKNTRVNITVKNRVHTGHMLSLEL